MLPRCVIYIQASPWITFLDSEGVCHTLNHTT